MKQKDRTMHRMFVLAAAIGLAALPATAHAGPLSPPAGPVAPTMRPLGEIEPRTAISAANTPGDATCIFAITQPGSYYLTGNVSGVSGKHGIKVAASGVTIDLNGFEMSGIAGAQVGISAMESASRVTVRGGRVRAWPDGGVRVSGADAALEHLHLDGNGNVGLWANQPVTMTDCRLTRNSGPGLDVSGGAVIYRTEASQNTFGFMISGHARIADCRAMNNSAGGFAIAGTGVLTGCSAMNNGGIGIAGFGVLDSCAAGSNTQDGIAWNGVINGSVAYNNGRHGIYASSGSRVTDNSCTGNGTAAGITDGSGIYATGDGGHISGNRCRANDRGITITSSANRVEDNHVTENSAYGLIVTGQYNIIIRNTSRNPSGVNWSIVAGNRAGAFHAPALAGAINGPSGGPGSGTTDPFANLSF